MSCRRISVGLRDHGARSEAQALPNRPRPKVEAPRGGPATIPSRASSPRLTSCKRQAVVDSAHLGGAGHQPLAGCGDDGGDHRQRRTGKYPPGYYSAKAVDELYALGVDPVAPEQTRRPLCHPRPEVAYPTICLGCDGSYRPGGVGNATLCGCKLWSRYSGQDWRR